MSGPEFTTLRESPLLAVRDVTVRFGGIVALDSVSFQMRAGQIVGLIGPNGAGKTTLFNCLSRLYAPDRRDILFDGRSILGLPPPSHRGARGEPDVPEPGALLDDDRAAERDDRRSQPHALRLREQRAAAAVGGARGGGDAARGRGADRRSGAAPGHQPSACPSSSRAEAPTPARPALSGPVAVHDPPPGPPVDRAACRQRSAAHQAAQGPLDLGPRQPEQARQ